MEPLTNYFLSIINKSMFPISTEYYKDISKHFRVKNDFSKNITEFIINNDMYQTEHLETDFRLINAMTPHIKTPISETRVGLITIGDIIQKNKKIFNIKPSKEENDNQHILAAAYIGVINQSKIEFVSGIMLTDIYNILENNFKI